MDVSAAASELLDMRRTQRVEADLPADLRPADLTTAYAIQAELVAGLRGDPIGYKCACTSPIAQDALRIDRPLFGRLLSETTSVSGTTLDASKFVHRVIEAEFGFRVARDIEPLDGGHTIESIADHVDAVIPAIEIVDYRYQSWTIGALQVAADNAIHGWWVHGEPVLDWRDLDLADCRVIVRRDDEVVTTGSGAAVLGHPLTVMAWLANELPRFGRSLRAGDVVTTGVTTDVFEAEAGDSIIAEFDGVGSVAVDFA
jgi:2-keto-4-pentenoate hydratase